MNRSVVVGMMVLGAVWGAQASVTDDFESGVFSSDWFDTDGASILSETGNQYARVQSGANQPYKTLGGYLGASSSETFSAFSVSFDFRFTDTNVRQMAVVIGGANDAASGTAGPAINLAYDGVDNRFEVYGGTSTGWVALTGLPTSLANATWHSVTIDGYNFGVGTGMYDITVNGTTQSEIQVFQEATDLGAMAGFNFNSAYGSNPGFDVDNVNAFAVPEPATSALVLLGLGGLVGLRRRG